MKYAAKVLTVAVLLFSMRSMANVCGSDYQNFNPTTNGLGFLTVHSSETLKPCVMNFGVYLNYAANSLTYSKTLNANLVSGQKQKDRTLGSDLTFGLGITENWDFGFSLPGVLSSKVENDYNVAAFENLGITEFKLNTKYKFLGDENGGVAAVLSINKNLVDENPYTGSNPGLTFNYELVADKVLNETWSIAGNVGYRQRNKGQQLAGVPFVPLDNQWIYSAAAGYNLPSYNSKLVAEIYGSKTATPFDLDTDRALSSLEALVGNKYSYSKNATINFGAGKQLDLSLGGADWRVFAGLTWTTDSICAPPPVAVAPPATVEEKKPEVYRVDTKVLFANDSDKLDLVNTSELDAVLKQIIDKKYGRIVVEGNTDSYGTKEYNMDLSVRRANRIMRYMVSKFEFDKSKITIIGNGEEKPVADNKNREKRPLNRNVEIKVWGQ